MLLNYEEKKTILKKIIVEYKSVLIAFSGGVDSSLLLKVAIDTLGSENVVAATGASLTITKEELDKARSLASELEARHIIINTSEFKNPQFLKNTPKRCYFCKSSLLSDLEIIKEKESCDVIMDGTNYDDQGDFRPGYEAVKEHGVITPLKDAFFTKKDIRQYSKELRLETWDMPAAACLASRIPYDEEITEKKIKRIAEGEKFLKSLKIPELRLRTDKHTARIEVPVIYFPLILEHREKIIEKLNALEFIYISLDLKGLRSGSMNEIL